MGSVGSVFGPTTKELDAGLIARVEPRGAPFVTVTSGEIFMRNMLFLLTLTSGLAIACGSNASAVPINAAAVTEVAASASSFQPTRWRRWPRGHTKCYREFVIGPYSCHWFPL